MMVMSENAYRGVVPAQAGTQYAAAIRERTAFVALGRDDGLKGLAR
jgi:hypothetical protein